MRTIELKTKKGEKAMKRLFLALLLFAIAGVSFLAPSAFAINPDVGYVIVKCTMTTSIDVLNGTDYVKINGGIAVAPNEIWISSYVAVKNDGTGSITRWSLRISTQHYSTDGSTWLDTTTSNVGWGYGETLTDNGLNNVVLAAAFAQGPTILSTDFGNEDCLLSTNTIYLAGAGAYGPATNAYATDFTSPNSYNMVANTSTNNTRRLFFYMRTPTAITDENYRRFTIMITATIGL
jgi:hypothetical protein